jgi:hypothetical protein
MRHAKHLQNRSQPRPRRLRLEYLEDRTMPATFLVNTPLDELTPGDGSLSLREALTAANDNPGPDEIDFADGLSGTIALTTGQLRITDDLTIAGPGADVLAVSGSNQSRVFSISGGATVAIAGLTITGGRAVGDGGGILNTGSALALDGVVLSDNQAVGAPGGAGRGGAIANVSGAALIVTDCLFTHNQALGGGQGFGGGILNLASRLTVSRSAFIGNQAIGGAGGGPARGGAIDTSNAPDVRISDSTFIGNQAIAGDGSGANGFGRGGGLFNTTGILTIERCTFQGNLARGGSNNTRGGALVAPAAGGGVMNGDAGALFLSGSTFTGNQALGGSGNTSTGGNGNVGAALGGGLNNAGVAAVADSLFEDNEARGGGGNRGDGVSFQFVGTALGGAICTVAGNSSGAPASLTLGNVTLRGNRAVGGDGNAAGTFVGAGIGGGLASAGYNALVPLSGGSTTALSDSTVEHNQAVGGSGGAALGGGVANLLGGVVTVSGSTLSHNQAQGGEGGDGFGGGLYNGAASTHPSNPGAPTVLTIEGSSITHNAAQGGAAGAGGSAGSGAGGGLWNGGTASVLDADISHNLALGGDGADGGVGGDGLGGGVFNNAGSSLLLNGCTVTKNHANGGEGGEGGSDGEGIGGGVYNLGRFEFDEFTLIFKNHASTSDDDVFDPVA